MRHSSLPMIWGLTALIAAYASQADSAANKPLVEVPRVATVGNLSAAGTAVASTPSDSARLPATPGSTGSIQGIQDTSSMTSARDRRAAK